MNEQHIIAAILASGLLAHHNDDKPQPQEAVALYEACLSELLKKTSR